MKRNKSNRFVSISTSITNRRSMLTLAAVSALSSLALSASAQLTFDPDGQLPLSSAGFGEWNTTVPRWYDGSSFVAYTPGTGNTANVTLPGGSMQLTGLEDVGAGNITILGNTTLYPPQAGPGARVVVLNNSTIDTGAFTLHSLAFLQSPSSSTVITKTGSGALVFQRGFGTGAGAVANAAGTINVNQGTLGFSHTSADLANATMLNVAAGATFDMGYTGGAVNDTFGGITGSGNIVLGTFVGRGVNLGSSLVVGSLTTGTGTYSGTISGGGQFRKTGTGTLVFDGTNTYTGFTSVIAGTLELEGGNAISDASDVYLNATAGAASFLRINTNERIGSLGGGTTTSSVEIGANTLYVGGNNTYNGFGGNLSGSGLIVKEGSALWAIQNTTPSNASYTGKWRIEGGILSFRDDARIGATPGAPVADHIQLAGGILANSSAGGGTWNANRGITVSADSGILILGSTASNLFIDGQITGSSKITKTGDGNLFLGGDNSTFSGDWVVRDGQLASARGLGTPFGTGGIDVSGSTVSIAPGAAGITVNHTLASGASEVFQFGPGSILNLNKNAGNTELNVTIGNAGAGSSTLVRGARGTMVVQANTGIASLGTAGSERLFVNGGVNLVNGIAPGVIGTTSAASTPGDFLTYDGTDGFKVATYTSTDLSTSLNTDVVNQTAGVTLSGPAAAYAVRIGDGVGGTAADLGGNTLTVGSGSDPAMVIVNTASSVTNGVVDFGSRQGVIYNQGAAGNFGAVITGSNGLSKIGAGPLNLGAAATYTGPTHISQGPVVLSGSDQLPTSTDLTIENNGALNIGDNSQTVASLTGNRTANVLMGANGVLAIGSGNSTYLGRINAGATAQGTLVKDGTGVLTLGQASSQTGNDSETLLYSKMVVKNGGVVSIGSTLVLPAAAPASTTGSPAIVVADTFTLDGGTLRFTQVNSAAFSNGGASTYTLSGGNTTLRGITVGAGGGTLEVTEAKEIVIYQRGNGAVINTDDAPLLSGSGVITKTGPGFFRLGIGNDVSFTGKWVVKEGNLQFGDGSALGRADSYVPDFLTLDGGMIQVNGFGTFTANQGITVAAGGGTLNASFLFSQEFRGSGPLNKITTSTARFDGSSPLWTSPINIYEGFVNAVGNDSLGTGLITITPKLQAGLFKLNGTSDTTLGNNIVLNNGSTIDVRVDASLGNLILTGNISGPAGFIKTGGLGNNGQGTLILSGNSTFAGDLVIDGGVVVAQSNAALGAATGLITVNPDASLMLEHATGINIATAKPLFLAGNGFVGLGALRNTSGDNTYAGAVVASQNTIIDVTGGSLDLPAGIRGASDVTVNGGGNLATGGFRINTLNINNPKVSVNAGRSAAKTSVVNTLNLNGQSLDLNDNDLVVDYTGSSPASTIKAALAQGYNAGAWNGTGGSGAIQSSVAGASPTGVGKTALGWAEASSVYTSFPALFSGVTVPDNEAVLVRYTWSGDATLDGEVDTLDFNMLAGSFGGAGDWFNGDFNYDGVVDSMDFGHITANHGQAAIAAPLPGADPFAASLAGSVVPEPGSLSILALGAAGLLGRRRRA